MIHKISHQLYTKLFLSSRRSTNSSPSSHLVLLNQFVDSDMMIFGSSSNQLIATTQIGCPCDITYQVGVSGEYFVGLPLVVFIYAKDLREGECIVYQLMSYDDEDDELLFTFAVFSRPQPTAIIAG